MATLKRNYHFKKKMMPKHQKKREKMNFDQQATFEAPVSWSKYSATAQQQRNIDLPCMIC
jgi:hypothetical protein